MVARNRKDDSHDGEEVFSAFITLRNGKRLYAWQKGLKAFRFVVKRRNPPTKPPKPKSS